MTRSILQVSVVVALALSAGACQTMADLDPTGLIGGSSPSSPDSQFPAGNAPQASDSAQTTPDLAALPARPVATPPSAQQQTAQAVTADGAQAQYSADVLRGGTEAAAPAPGTADSAPLPQAVASNAPPTTDAAPIADAAPTTDAAPAAQAPRPSSPNAAVPAVGAGRQAAPVRTAALAPSAGSAPPSAAMPSSPVPGAEPAVPANTPFRGAGNAGVTPSDAALGFQPSAAPPLNASINQWVPAPIVARYRQTASNAGISASSAAAAVPSRSGGPDMSGSVVANLGAIPSGPASVAAVNGGDAPTAVVYFPGDGTSLSAAARSQIRSAVQSFKAAGGTNSIRVIGHASSRTANMPVEKHLELIFSKSQARANAVAQELIHQGVPADKVLVDAVGDSQPVYYESMPKGEDGNRRADIFIQ